MSESAAALPCAYDALFLRNIYLFPFMPVFGFLVHLFTSLLLWNLSQKQVAQPSTLLSPPWYQGSGRESGPGHWLETGHI
jgi:hypothetical protein